MYAIRATDCAPRVVLVHIRNMRCTFDPLFSTLRVDTVIMLHVYMYNPINWFSAVLRFFVKAHVLMPNAAA